jgi:molybdopterin biosynthesis enzyme
MYSRILFVTALFGAVNAIKLGAHQEVEAEAEAAVAVDTTDNVPEDFVAEVAVEGTKDTKKHGEAEFQKTAEYMQGKTGEFTADDGTTFVTGAKEQDA